MAIEEYDEWVLDSMRTVIREEESDVDVEIDKDLIWHNGWFNNQDFDGEELPEPQPRRNSVHRRHKPNKQNINVSTVTKLLLNILTRLFYFRKERV